MERTMRVVIVGCGLIGKKRFAALPKDALLVGAVDPVPGRARSLTDLVPGAQALEDYREAFKALRADVAFVATTNDHLVPASLAAIQAGCHLLVEKPAARSARELDDLRLAAKAQGRVVAVGFNHRYHRAFRKARELFELNELGPLMFVRARYGHGGRIGYDREWRADPVRAGGGELLDQGVHLIDLARWFFGDFSTVRGTIGTFFWDMQVEDNGFLHLETTDGKIAWLHASCTEWKNLFSFELYGRNAKLHIEGLGGSYGIERLSFYKMLPAMGPPETTIWEYPGEDDSWQVEVADFISKIRQPDSHRNLASLDDAMAALRVVNQVYRLKKSI